MLRPNAEFCSGELRREIKSTGFFRNKAKMIPGIHPQLVTPLWRKGAGSFGRLDHLAGNRPKTANVILGTAFGVPGIVVDTHVLRVSERLGLTKNTDPVKVEFDLMEIVPKKAWIDFSHLIVFHGRYVCNARKPLCEQCSLTPYCDYFQKTLPLKK